MGDEMIVAIALVVAVILGGIYYKSRMSGGTKKHKLLETAKRKGNVTTAVFIDSELLVANRDGESLRSRTRKLQARYEYRVNGVSYMKTLYFINTGGVGLSCPNQVTVYYDARNPKNAVCAEETSEYTKRQSGCLGALGIGFVTVVVVVNLLRILLG